MLEYWNEIKAKEIKGRIEKRRKAELAEEGGLQRERA
jgi:hypothetical protein